MILLKVSEGTFVRFLKVILYALNGAEVWVSTSIFMKTTDADSFPVPSVLLVSVKEDTTALMMLTPCMPKY